jgi:hypothetical protein
MKPTTALAIWMALVIPTSLLLFTSSLPTQTAVAFTLALVISSALLITHEHD